MIHLCPVVRPADNSLSEPKCYRKSLTEETAQSLDSDGITAKELWEWSSRGQSQGTKTYWTLLRIDYEVNRGLAVAQGSGSTLLAVLFTVG